MVQQALLIEKRSDHWLCAVMSLTADKRPRFSHYKGLTAKTAVQAVEAYRLSLGMGNDWPVGVVAVPEALEGCPDTWLGLAPEKAMAYGLGWDGKGQVVPTFQITLEDRLSVPDLPHAGQAAFAPSFAGAAKVFDLLQSVYGFVSRDDVISFHGLKAIYDAIEDENPTGNGSKRSVAQIFDTIDVDAISAQAVAYLADAMAATVGDILLEAGWNGPVALIGGLANSLLPHVDRERFGALVTTKGAASERLSKVEVYWPEGDHAALKGLAASMATTLQAQPEPAGTSDPEALSRAWQAVADEPAWAIDAALRLVEVKNILWTDQLCANVNAEPGMPLGALLHAMASEGLLEDDKNPALILSAMARGEDVSFARLGFGGRKIVCQAMHIPGGGYIIREESDVPQQAKAPVQPKKYTPEPPVAEEDVLDLTSAEEVLDAAVAASPLVREGAEPRRVMIYDTNIVGRMITKALFAEEGYDTLVVGEREEALDLYEMERPDIVIIDLDADEHAFDVISDLREMDEEDTALSSALLIGTTASATAEQRHAAIEAGLDECFVRPLQHDKVFAMIRQWAGEESLYGSTGSLAIGA